MAKVSVAAPEAVGSGLLSRWRDIQPQIPCRACRCACRGPYSIVGEADCDGTVAGVRSPLEELTWRYSQGNNL